MPCQDSIDCITDIDVLLEEMEDCIIEKDYVTVEKKLRCAKNIIFELKEDVCMDTGREVELKAMILTK